MGGGWRRCGQIILDSHEFVGIGALISIGTDGRGNGPDRDRASGARLSGHIAAAAGGRIEGRRIVRNTVGDTDIEPILQYIGQHPGAVLQHPFLHAGIGQRVPVRDVGLAVDDLSGYRSKNRRRSADLCCPV